MKNFGAEIIADPVIDEIPQTCRHKQHQNQNINIHSPQRRQRHCNKKQRITGQEGRHHHPGFEEDHCEKNGVNPCSVLLNKQGQMLIQM